MPEASKDQAGAQTQLPRQRQARVREQMLSRGIPALLVLDPVNILYATAASNMPIFSIRTPARYLLLFAEGPAILFDYRGCEHLSAGLETIDDVRAARGLCHISSGGDATGQAVAMAAEISAVFRDLGIPPERLALDRFPFPVIDALRAGGFELSDADEIFSAARRVKLPAEIALMRSAMERVVTAAAEMEASIEPGRSETEIWADFIGPFVASEGRYVTTRLLQSGSRTFPYFQEAGARIVQQGDLVCFDTDAVGYAGYCVDFSRTYLCGDQPASSMQIELYARAREQLEHNVSLFRPGASFEEIAYAAWQIPPQHQQSRYYCIGHGLGMSGEFPNIPHAIPGEPYPLDGEVEPGMVICIESYIGSEPGGQGVKLEEQLLIHADSVERMSSSMPFDERLMPKQLP